MGRTGWITTNIYRVASLASVHFTAVPPSNPAGLPVAASGLQETHFDACLSGRRPSARRRAGTGPRLFDGRRDVISDFQPQSSPLIFCCRAPVDVRGS